MNEKKFRLIIRGKGIPDSIYIRSYSELCMDIIGTLALIQNNEMKDIRKIIIEILK